MNGYIGYIRVSTARQGTQGVSLQEQRDAILRYAERSQLKITLWLEEMETAAKQGRPLFKQAINHLQSGKAKGIILHKLDRGARNLRDWIDIGDLSDQGIEVHFVTEGIDLQTRGGRLSADIQAAVAADYIRNLKEETRKGFYGRLKQGLYPLQAPLGYLDQGGGKPKIIDPVAGPLIRRGFELYASNTYNLRSLEKKLYELGLRNRNGKRLYLGSIAYILNNPFYFGLIHVRKTNEAFNGVHEPLIDKQMFDKVQAILTSKSNSKSIKHDFRFRRVLKCAGCHYTLIGELQKGMVYYRCHNRNCPETGIREDGANKTILKFLERIQFDEKEEESIKAWFAKKQATLSTYTQEGTKALTLQLNLIKDRLNRLTDAYIDQGLDKVMFEERKKSLLSEQKDCEQNLLNLKRNTSSTEALTKFLELARNAPLSYKIASSAESRIILKTITSNCSVLDKKLQLEPSLAFKDIVNRSKDDGCAPEQIIPRTWELILENLAKLQVKGLLPDLTQLAYFRQIDVK